MNIIRFLKKHNLYDKALQYTKKAYGFEDREKAKKYYEYYEDSPTLIGFFEFHRTEEGADFWASIDNKFKQINNKNKYGKIAY